MPDSSRPSVRVIWRERRSQSSSRRRDGRLLGPERNVFKPWAFRAAGGSWIDPERSTAFRILLVIPIAIVLGAVSGGTWE